MLHHYETVYNLIFFYTGVMERALKNICSLQIFLIIDLIIYPHFQ